jgi:cytochrome b involved in lipid metabolism
VGLFVVVFVCVFFNVDCEMSISFASVKARNLIVLHENVYDLSSFNHPGGFEVLRPLFGHDGTVEYVKHHSKDFLALAEKCLIGRIDVKDVAWQEDVKAGLEKQKEKVEVAVVGAGNKKPVLESMLNVSDFRAIAEANMTPAGENMWKTFFFVYLS